jgi:membrane-bound ClpP family serine protease
MAKKMASTPRYARTLASHRKRNVTPLEQAVLESRSFTEQEALRRPRHSSICRDDVPDPPQARRADDYAL